MIASVLLELLLRSALLLGVIWLSAEILRRCGASAAMRHMIWTFGFAGLALLPLLAAIVPQIPLPVLPADPAVTAVVPADGSVAPMALQDTPMPSAVNMLQLLYFGVAFGLFGRLIAGHAILARIWAGARDLADRKRLRLVDELCSALRVGVTVRVRFSSAVSVPMTWGTLRPRILLPLAASGWTDEQWQVVLLHELGHVARRDSAGRTAAAMICAFYWANPIAWIAAERMRREQEHACDDLVLSQGADAAVYARNLLIAARSVQEFSPELAAAMISRPRLEARLIAIVGDVPRRRAGRSFALGSGLACLATLSLAAALTPVAATAPVPPQAELPMQSPVEAPAVDLAPTAPSAAAIATNSHIRHSARRATAATTTPLPTLAALESAQAAQNSVSAAAYAQALATYREQKAQYLVELDAYRVKMAAYRAAMDKYRRDMADHQRLVEEIRALPEGDARKVVPPAPPAPVAPVAPVTPVPPVVPTDLHS